MASNPSGIANSAGLARNHGGYSVKGLLQRVLAVAVLAAAFIFVARFPTAPVFLAALFTIYVLISLRYPDAWLVAVPALLPLLYLTPWSGRLFFDEFDVLMLCTLAAGLWHQRFRGNLLRASSGSRIVLLLFTVLYVVAMWRGLGNLSALDLNSWANYYSPLSALRTGKGFLWALLCYPIWFSAWSENPERSNRLLALGVMVGILGLAVVVLWERGVWHDIVYYQNRYKLLGSLLDFGTQYRITGLFADMHTGGTAIDGYLSLVWPFAALMLLTGRARWLQILSAAALLAGFYAMVVTFSRGVYLGFGVASMTALLLGYLSNRREIPFRLVLLTLLCAVVALATSVLAFRAGGVAAIAASLLTYAIGAAYVIARERGRGSFVLMWLSACGVMLAAAVAAYAAATSKWTHFATGPGMLLGSANALIFALIGATLNHYWRRQLSVRNRVLVSLMLCGVIAAFVPSLFGSRMEQRFATAGEDLQHRFEHWQDAIKVMDDDWATWLFGQGTGRFPERYLWVKQQPEDVGAFLFVQEANNTYLRFAGAKDVRLGQRVALQPNTAYTLSLDVRTEAPRLRMHLRICHRHLIHSTEWNPACATFSQALKRTDGQWQHLEFQFDSEDLGSLKRHLQSPLVLVLANRRGYDLLSRPQTLLDFDNLSLRPLGSSEELLRNGGFERGIDHWFGYYDFNHLPWHIKNLWVHIYFELGLLGLLAFLMLIATTLAGLLTPVPNTNDQRAFAITTLLALVGFLAVGTFGTLLDAPRVAFLFYLLLLSGLPKLQRLKTSPRSYVRSRPGGHSASP